jgi:hypothetical protein
MSKLISKNLITVDLGDGEWAKIPEDISYGDIVELKNIEEKERDIVVLKKFIREWNIKEGDGTIAALNEENIKRIDVDSAEKIITVIQEVLVKVTDKKKSQSATQT